MIRVEQKCILLTVIDEVITDPILNEIDFNCNASRWRSRYLCTTRFHVQ